MSIDSLIELGLKANDLSTQITNLDQRYIELLVRGEWTPKSFIENHESALLSLNGNASGTISVRNVLCFNCGGLGHGVNECKSPLNNETIAMQKELMTS